MSPATSPLWRSRGHLLAEDTFSHRPQKRTHRGICPLWRQLSFGVHLAGLLCQSASEDSGCVCCGSPPAHFYFKKGVMCSVTRSHPVIWAKHDLGAHQMATTTGTQWRAPIWHQSHRKLQTSRWDSGGFWGKGNALTYRAAHWRGGSATCQGASETRKQGGDYSTQAFSGAIAGKECYCK